jgi:glycine/D-amino acid oxidase-like deaminating enzyme
LRGRHRTDVVIVGGGLTGTLAAQGFASAGVGVSLLEASLVGRGSTAASAALLLQEPDRSLHALERRYGRGGGRRIWRISRDAVGDLIDTLRALHIDCDVEEQAALYYAPTAQAAVSLRREFRARVAAHLEAEWVEPDAAGRIDGVPARGAIRTRGNAQADPYRACIGLAAAAAAAGASIFERSPVTRIDAAGGGVRVHTAGGRIDASRVVIATGYATPRFRPLAARFRMYRTYVLATRPFDARDRRALGLGRSMRWDTDRPYHYARWTSDHRLLLGGGDRRLGAGRQKKPAFRRATRALFDHFRTLLPALVPADIEFAWDGLFAMTPDSLPFIGPHRRYPGHLFALGYGGNGMTFSALAARLLLESWLGRPSADQRFFRFGRFR